MNLTILRRVSFTNRYFRSGSTLNSKKKQKNLNWLFRKWRMSVTRKKKTCLNKKRTKVYQRAFPKSIITALSVKHRYRSLNGRCNKFITKLRTTCCEIGLNWAHCKSLTLNSHAKCTFARILLGRIELNNFSATSSTINNSVNLFSSFLHFPRKVKSFTFCPIK